VMGKHMGCRSTLTLVNETSFRELTAPLGIDAFISPQSITISRILQHVRRGRIRSVHSIQNGRAEIIEAEALETSPLVGQPLADLNIPDEVRLGAVFREDRYIQPCATTEIEAGDRVVIFAKAGAVRHVEQMFRVSLEFF
jgi:trk system potassium uptake protein